MSFWTLRFTSSEPSEDKKDDEVEEELVDSNPVLGLEFGLLELGLLEFWSFVTWVLSSFDIGCSCLLLLVSLFFFCWIVRFVIRTFLHRNFLRCTPPWVLFVFLLSTLVCC